MRIRNRIRTGISQPTVVTHLGGGVPFLPYQVPGYGFLEQESSVDRTTPGFNGPRTGFLPQNPFTYSMKTYHEDKSTLVYFDSNGVRSRKCVGSVTQFLYSTNPGQGFTALPPPTATGYNLGLLIAEANAKALEKFSTPEYSFGEPISEIVSTIRSIKQPLRAINRLVSRWQKRKRLLKRSNFKNAKDYAQALAALWLSYSVNAGPNLRTISDAIDAYARKSYARATLSVAFAKTSYDSGPLYGQATQTPSLGGLRTVERVLRASVKSVILYQILDAADPKAILGLKMRHVPGLLWELVPGSFLIDRVYNVKRFVNVASALKSSKLRVCGACIVTRVDDVVTRRVCNMTVTGSPAPSPRDSPPYVVRDFKYDRQPWHPSAADVVPPRKMKNVLRSLHQTLDLASIILGKMRG